MRWECDLFAISQNYVRIRGNQHNGVTEIHFLALTVFRDSDYGGSPELYFDGLAVYQAHT